MQLDFPPVYVDAALLCLRVLVAAIFFWSGLAHARDPAARGESIGASPGFTRFLGIAEMAGALGLVAARTIVVGNRPRSGTPPSSPGLRATPLLAVNHAHARRV